MMKETNICFMITLSLFLCLPLCVSGNSKYIPVDRTFDDNMNDFQYYWDYYDDNRQVGKNDRPQVADPGMPSLINGNSKDTVRHAFGDLSDNHVYKCYEFTTHEENGNRFATMPFTLGSKWNTSWGSAAPYVGIGTGLVRSGSSIDLSNMQGVRFNVRTRQNNLIVRFKLQTYEIDSISNVPSTMLTGDEFGYYCTEFSTKANIWSTITVSLDSLDLPGTWAREIPFNVKRCTRLTWEISGEDNDAVKSDTFDIDDVVLLPADYHCHEEWTRSESLFPLPSTGLFLNFEPGSVSPVQQNLLWYGFTDKSLYGNRLTITNGSPIENANGLYRIPVSDNITGPETEHILQVSYTYDTTINSNTYHTLAGLEINMYDSIRNSYWDATAGASKIYFHYKTDTQVEYLKFEVFDDYDYTTPISSSSRIDNEGNAARWKCLLWDLDDEWQAVSLPLDALSFCFTLKDEEPEPLHVSKIAKFRWQAVGRAGTGSFAIDNIYFPGVNFAQTRAVTPQEKGSILKPLEKLHVLYQNGSIKIGGLTGELLFRSVYYAIHNNRGQKMSQGKIIRGNDTSIIPDRLLSAGMYVVSISSCSDLKKNTHHLPLFVVK